MNPSGVTSGNHLRGEFTRRVQKLRAKIAEFQLSGREQLSNTEVEDLQSLTQNKVANIIEFTLRANNIKVYRQKIQELVKRHISEFPIIQEVHSGRMSIPEGEKEFSQFLEGRRVKNPEIRLWISKMVNEYIKSITEK